MHRFMLFISTIVIGGAAYAQSAAESVNQQVLEKLQHVDMDALAHDTSTTREVEETVRYYINDQIGALSDLPDSPAEHPVHYKPRISVSGSGSEDNLNASMGIFVPWAPKGLSDSAAYVDITGSGNFSDDFGDNIEFSAGVGIRKEVLNPTKKQAVILGINSFVDGNFDENDDFMGQVSIGLEAAGEHFSLYGNAYMPFENYGDAGELVDGACVPRKGADIGLSAHVPLINNRQLHAASYAELELYGQGFFYTEEGALREYHGGIGGASLKYMSDFGGMLPKYSRIEPYVEAVWDNVNEDENMQGGLELSIPFGTDKMGNFEANPRYYMAMASRAKRNLGFSGACKPAYQKESFNQCNPDDFNTLNLAILNGTITNEAADEQCATNNATLYINSNTLGGTVLLSAVELNSQSCVNASTGEVTIIPSASTCPAGTVVSIGSCSCPGRSPATPAGSLQCLITSNDDCPIGTYADVENCECVKLPTCQSSTNAGVIAHSFSEDFPLGKDVACKTQCGEKSFSTALVHLCDALGSLAVVENNNGAFCGVSCALQ